MLGVDDHSTEIEDVLAILGANGAGEIRVAANRGLNSMPGSEYVAKLRSDPRKTLAVSVRTARALLAAGAVLAEA